MPPPLPRAVGPTNATGAAVASVGGIVAVIAYFALPYVNLGILGSLTGAQTANLIDSAYSAAQQFSSYSSAYSTGTTPSSSGGGVSPGLILWAEVILAGIAGGIALTQWLRSRNGGAPPARGGMIAVLITALVSLLILLYQLVGLESSTLGQMLASALGFGFWLMILGMLAAVSGAIAQMRAR